MRYEAVNERGTVKQLADSGRFRFVYGNDFYGSCTFTAEVAPCEQQNFFLREKSIVLEDHESKKGDLKALMGVSVTFFKRILSRYPGELGTEHRLRYTEPGKTSRSLSARVWQ